MLVGGKELTRLNFLKFYYMLRICGKNIDAGLGATLNIR